MRQADSRARSLLAVLIPAVLVGGCCGGLPPSGSVVATVEPAEATVAAGGTVTLAGNATGLASVLDSTSSYWGVQDNPYISTCQEINHITTGCTMGFVTFASEHGLPNSATYHAPASPGTYHVMFNVFVSGKCIGDMLNRTATATITVTP